MASINDDITELIYPVLTNMGYELVGIKYKESKYSVLQIYIDSDTGVFVNDCELASKKISAILDAKDLITAQYNLEVSSPGINRPLFTLAHYQRFLGYDVKIKLNTSYLGTKKILGRIEKVSEITNSIDIKTKLENINIKFDNINCANLVIDF